MAEEEILNGMFVIEKPSHAECPECGWLYLSGEAIIMLCLNGQQSFIGQGADEVHECSNCKKQIRGGGKPALFAIFPSVEVAEEKVIELTGLLFSNPEEFCRKVVLCQPSALILIKNQ